MQQKECDAFNESNDFANGGLSDRPFTVEDSLVEREEFIRFYEILKRTCPTKSSSNTASLNGHNNGTINNNVGARANNNVGARANNNVGVRANTNGLVPTQIPYLMSQPTIQPPVVANLHPNHVTTVLNNGASTNRSQPFQTMGETQF
jgi:hypothetical protein